MLGLCLTVAVADDRGTTCVQVVRYQPHPSLFVKAFRPAREARHSSTVFPNSPAKTYSDIASNSSSDDEMRALTFSLLAGRCLWPPFSGFLQRDMLLGALYGSHAGIKLHALEATAVPPPFACFDNFARLPML
jgi:hypothetical protein